MQAAAEQFLAHGYDATKLDEIVRNAHVSKTAIYKFYGGKRELFIALAEHLTEDFLKHTSEKKSFKIESMAELEMILKNIGRDYLDCVLHPDNLAKFRMSLAMATRVEEVSKKFFYSGHVRLCQFISGYLRAATDAGLTEFKDTEHAASQYLGLLRADTHLKSIFDADYVATAQEISQSIDAAMNIFLYGCTSNRPA